MDRGYHAETRGIKTERLQHAYNGHYKTAFMYQTELTSIRQTATKFGVDESNGHHGLSTKGKLLIAASTHACIWTHRTLRDLKHDRQPDVHEYMLSSV